MPIRTCDAETPSTRGNLSPALKQLLQALIEAPESDCCTLGERLHNTLQMGLEQKSDVRLGGAEFKIHYTETGKRNHESCKSKSYKSS